MASVNPVIIVFAKTPVPGRVKTRLTRRISPNHAARLHYALVGDLLDTLTSLPAVPRVELHIDTPTDAWPEAKVTRQLQIGASLAERLLYALEAGLARGHCPVLILGGDTPLLEAQHVEAILESRADVTLGPTIDGGFYAISCRRAHRLMFRAVEWSTSDTLDRTRAACERCGLSVALSREWFDVDEPEDLERLAGQPRLTPRLAAWMQAHYSPGNCSGVSE